MENYRHEESLRDQDSDCTTHRELWLFCTGCWFPPVGSRIGLLCLFPVLNSITSRWPKAPPGRCSVHRVLREVKLTFGHQDGRVWKIRGPSQSTDLPVGFSLNQPEKGTHKNGRAHLTRPALGLHYDPSSGGLSAPRGSGGAGTGDGA